MSPAMADPAKLARRCIPVAPIIAGDRKSAPPRRQTADIREFRSIVAINREALPAASSGPRSRFTSPLRPRSQIIARNDPEQSP